MDLTRDVVYRAFLLNDSTVTERLSAGSPITGCVLDSFDLSDVDVTQFIEKRSQRDGMDSGEVSLGARRVRMGGTLYGSDRPDLYDRLWALRAALSPTLAQREEPADHGYRPLYFSVPTNDPDYGSQQIDLMVKAMPRAFSASIMRDLEGGGDSDALAIPWQATFICADPSIMSAASVGGDFTAQTLHSDWTALASTDVISSTEDLHGLVAGDIVWFTTLTGGAGLSVNTSYYVIASGLTTQAFKVSTTPGGAAVNITTNYSSVAFVKSAIDSGADLDNRGTYPSPVNALWYVGTGAGSINATIGDSTFTITIPSSTNGRIIRFNGDDGNITVQEVDPLDPEVVRSTETPAFSMVSFTTGTWPSIPPGPGQSYSFTTHGAVQQAGSRWWFYERYA